MTAIQNKHMWLGNVQWTRDYIFMTYGIDDLCFSTSYWYEGLDLSQLEQRYGASFMEKLMFHIIAFEANKLVSLCPVTFDLGPYAHLYTEAFETLWKKIVRHVWAQWRYENKQPYYEGPVLLNRSPISKVAPITLEPGSVEVLSFCGGGKDSAVSMKLLERSGISYDSFAYSHSVYGNANMQHELIDRLLDINHPRNRRRQWAYDNFMDSPILQLHPEYQSQSLLAAETPSSIFGVLPLVLQHGYRYIALGHERSADVGNLIWEETGEDVNHQWGKSLEAEHLLNDYLQQELVSNFSYFSILKPIYDVLIFNLLAQDLDAVPRTHSCNIRKPWCGECPKCAYVWVNYMAYLPPDLVEGIFQSNLFDQETNQLWFRQMLGLEKHTPFECIGQIDEARLAFELCRRKGLTGKAMNMYQSEIRDLNMAAILDKYLTVNTAISTIPATIAKGVIPQMQRMVDSSRKEILACLKN